jgi:hypothetical protein
MGFTQAGLLVLVATCALVAGGVGCRSAGSDNIRTQSHAAVVIHSATPEQIQQTAIEVFKLDLYDVAKSSTTHLVFEKPGSRMADIAYGGWLQGDVWLRVKVDIKSYTQNSMVVECNGFMIRDHGDSFFEEETRLPWFRKKPFQDLLDRVKNRLN